MRFPDSVRLFWLIVLCSCGGHFRPSGAPSTDGQKISVSRDQVFDLSGYAGTGGGDPYRLFDENAFVDPRYEKEPEPFIPVTNCQPTIHPSIYFHGREGNRIVVDLKIPCDVREIYYYDRSLTADSFQIYTGDPGHWERKVSLTTVSQPESWGWKKISLESQTRFLMIRFSSYQSAVTEMVLYGTPTGKWPEAQDYSRQKGFTHSPLDQFLGVNYIMEKDPRWLKPFHFSRLYNVALDYDNDTAKGTEPRFNMLHYGYFDHRLGKYVFDIDNLKKINDGDIWFNIRGVSKWMSDLGYTDKDRPLNRPLMNPEDPFSYSRHAEMMWHLAAFFGHHPVDTNLLSLSHTPRQTGRGSMDWYENGNEEDANWVGDKYCLPTEYFAQSTADWDGDEGRLGKRRGIHSADPEARLMMSGLTGLDTNRVRVYDFLNRNLRRDPSFIWQAGIQYHYYAQRDGRGISPEADSMRWKLKQVADFSYRLAPGVKCILGENGYDKSPVSRQRTPLIPGSSASRSQGIMLLRSINACFFSGFDAYILYWLRDAVPETDPNTFLTSGILQSLPDGKTRAYPGWFYISTLVNRLGKYRPDTVISEQGDVWVYRYVHTEQPDSVVYFLYKPTVTGTRVPAYTLDLGKTIDPAVLKITFLDDSEQGSVEKVPVPDKKIRLAVEEIPVLIFCRERRGIP